MKQIDEMFNRFLKGQPIIKSERWRMFPLIVGYKESGSPIYMLCILNHNHLWMIINTVNQNSNCDLTVIYEREPETVSDKRGRNAIFNRLPAYKEELANQLIQANRGDLLWLRKPMKYDYFNQYNDYKGGYKM